MLQKHPRGDDAVCSSPCRARAVPPWLFSTVGVMQSDAGGACSISVKHHWAGPFPSLWPALLRPSRADGCFPPASSEEIGGGARRLARPVPGRQLVRLRAAWGSGPTPCIITKRRHLGRSPGRNRPNGLVFLLLSIARLLSRLC